MRTYRYFEWTTTPSEQFSGDQLMDALSDYLTEDGDIARAMQMAMQRGMSSGDQKMQGVRDMLEQLRQRKQQQLEKYDLNSLLNELREKLDKLLQQERRAVDEQLDKAPSPPAPTSPQSSSPQPMASEQRRQFLENLPASLPQQIQALRPYEFLDAQAAQAFQDLLDELQQRAMGAQMNGRSTPSDQSAADDVQAQREMYRDLNQQLRERSQGQHPDFQHFKDQHPEFPSAEHGDLEELIQHLQEQLRQWQSLMDSLLESVRRELEQLMAGALDDDLQAEQAELEHFLNQLADKKPASQRYRFKGREEISLEQAQELMQQLQRMEELEKQLEGLRWSGDPQQVDAEKLQEILGDEAFQSIQNMKDISTELEAAGYIVKTKDGLQLTPRAMRKIGQKALRDIFFFIKKRNRLGDHDTRQRGGVGIPIEENKPYEFGDPLLLDLGATVFNAVSREGVGTPVSLHVDDFVVRRQEYLSHTSTVILIDMSGSMAWNNCFHAAKKVALALDNLVRSSFPRDTLQIVGFYTAAEEMKTTDLPYVKPKSFGYNASLYSDYYDMLMGYIDVQIDYREVVRGRTNVPQGFTNMQQGLRMAEQMLSKRQSPNKQIILITDGQPTAHCEGDRLYLQYPPSQRTIAATLLEVKRCTSKGIAINTFMLAKSYYLERFVDQMTKINHGRAFYTTPEQLGQYLVVDYLAKKRRQIA